MGQDIPQNVQQWLGEIRGLQQKLVEVQQERDQAYGSAANWRQLYETEARQRRSETQAARESIDALKIELAALQLPSPDAANYPESVREQVAQWQTPEDLRNKLMEVLAERDQLRQALEDEHQAHLQTRQDLTTALGDTMDLLAKARGHQAGQHSGPYASNVVPLRPEAR
jgi:hypothetical protein